MLAGAKQRDQVPAASGLTIRVASGNLQGLIPRDGLEPALPLAPDAPHQPEQAIRAVDTLEVAGHLLTQESTRERMIRIAAQVGGHAVLDGDEHAACVRTIEGADVLDDL